MMTNKQAKEVYGDRHPSTLHMLRMLQPNTNLPDHLYQIATDIQDLAANLLISHDLNDGPELTTGLRKLLEAKDCFVRASLDSDPVDYRDR
jgi:hypothetical protein